MGFNSAFKGLIEEFPLFVKHKTEQFYTAWCHALK